MDMLCGRRNRALKFMILFSICSAAIGMCACAGGKPVENPNTYAVSGNEMCTGVSDNDAEPDIQEMNVSHEIDEYMKKFMGLYTSNALEDMESQLMIEEGEFSSQNENGATIIKYSDLSGNTLRYELHYYGETGNRIVNYYLCENFYWIGSQMNYYSSPVFKPDYLNVLYSEVENWIVMGEPVYVMHDSGKLEEADQAQLEIPLLEEVEGYMQERDSKEVPQSDEPIAPDYIDSSIIEFWGTDEYNQIKNEFMEEGWLVCESWGNFDEDVPFVEEEIYEILKAAYAEIDFKGEFKKGDLDRYDEYKAVFQKLLQNEAPFLDNETGEEIYIKNVPELHYNPNGADHDENAYRYYFFDIDEDGLPEMGICNRKERANEIFFFKSDSQDGKINLWHQSGGWQIWFGSGKLGNSWGGGQYMEFTEFGSDREEKCKTNTFTIYGKENLRMVMAPIYADKQKEIEITDEMKSQGVYDLFWGQWYFRITDEQYHELTDGYWEAYKTAEERIKDVTYTYEELFGSL